MVSETHGNLEKGGLTRTPARRYAVDVAPTMSSTCYEITWGSDGDGRKSIYRVRDLEECECAGTSTPRRHRDSSGGKSIVGNR